MKVITEIFIKFILPLIQLIGIFLIMDFFRFYHKEHIITAYQAYKYSGLCLLVMYVLGFLIIIKGIKRNYPFYLILQIIIGFIYIFFYLMTGFDGYMTYN